MPLRLVLDTNVWLDWLVFDDPGLTALRAAVTSGDGEIVINAACEAELVRVLGYPLQRWALDAARQSACLAQCRSLARRIETQCPAVLPRCDDPDDQKFLELAAGAKAHYLVSKDLALLALARHRPPLPFRIVTPAGFGAQRSSHPA
jgi:putative PIN family toxin of toxin-antitoxin system